MGKRKSEGATSTVSYLHLHKGLTARTQQRPRCPLHVAMRGGWLFEPPAAPASAWRAGPLGLLCCSLGERRTSHVWALRLLADGVELEVAQRVAEELVAVSLRRALSQPRRLARAQPCARAAAGAAGGFRQARRKETPPGHVLGRAAGGAQQREGFPSLSDGGGDKVPRSRTLWRRPGARSQTARALGGGTRPNKRAGTFGEFWGRRASGARGCAHGAAARGACARTNPLGAALRRSEGGGMSRRRGAARRAGCVLWPRHRRVCGGAAAPNAGDVARTRCDGAALMPSGRVARRPGRCLQARERRATHLLRTAHSVSSPREAPPAAAAAPPPAPALARALARRKELVARQ